MKALLVRHGQSAANADTSAIAISHELGDRLTDRGREQARTVGESLRASGVTHLISSPMNRARETARLIGEQIGISELEVDETIHELAESAEYPTLPLEEQKARRWSVRMAAHPDDPDHHDGGESFNEIRGRARAFGERLAARDPGSTPLVVSHGIFLRFFLMDSMLGDALVPSMTDRMWWLRSTNCGVSVFEHDEPYHPHDPPREGWVCASWMSTPWVAP